MNVAWHRFKKLSAIESFCVEISLSITGMLVNAQYNHLLLLFTIFIQSVKAPSSYSMLIHLLRIRNYTHFLLCKNSNKLPQVQ